MTKAKKLDLISLIIVLVVILSSFYFLSILPDRVITHWNFQGEADGWGSKHIVTTLIPLIMLFMYFLFKFLPKIDPKKRNYENFIGVYKAIQLLIIFFFAIIYYVTTLVNLGIHLSISHLMPMLIGLLFIVMGSFFKKIKPNWFMGIRTPWTLSSDEVWKKTHEFGGKTFMLGGLLFIIWPFLPVGLSGWFIGLIIILLLSSIVYSYIIYRKIGDK